MKRTSPDCWCLNIGLQRAQANERAGDMDKRKLSQPGIPRECLNFGLQRAQANERAGDMDEEKNVSTGHA